MLKLKTKVSNNGNLIPIELQDFYLSPDLSFISGTTDGDYMFPLNDTVILSTQFSPAPDMLEGRITDVIRKGTVKLNKRYPVMTGKRYSSYIDIHDKVSGETFDYHYIYVNGKYYYENQGVYKVNGTEFTSNSGSVIIPTTYYIENDTVNIDDTTYYIDFNGSLNNNEKMGCLLDKKDGEPINVYKKEGNSFSQFVVLEENNGETVKSYSADTTIEIYEAKEQQKIHKIIAFKNKDKVIDFDSITFCKRDYYVNYKNYKCKVEEKISNKEEHTWEWGCYVPISNSDGGITNQWFTLCYNDDQPFTGKGHTDFDEWLTEETKTLPYVNIDGQHFIAQPVVRNSNEGKEIIIYSTEGNLPFRAGSIITLKRGNVIQYKIAVQYGETSIDSGQTFVFYNGQKYPVKARLCDYINIGGETFHVSYPNGIASGKNASVDIYGTPITMQIANDGKLYREGYYVHSTNSGATYGKQTSGYVINQQSGITIGDVNYPIMSISGDSYLTLYSDTPHSFIINEILGSSAYICTPYFENTDLTVDFIKTATKGICREVVENQSQFKVFYNNNLFGVRKVEPINGFLISDTPTSSDDFCRIEDYLRVYVNTGYISVSLPLSFNAGTNLQQDLLLGGTYANERAAEYINPIVDMEKDVFSPAFCGATDSATNKPIFEDVSELEFNLHFRTRDQDSWKIIEDECYWDTDTSSVTHTARSNWFVLDNEPYSEESRKELLQETPDLLGFLYFTTNDVFYQKNKLAKSFLRLSFYDSTNPYTQMLLATSTIFIDEGKLYQENAKNVKKGSFKSVPLNGTGIIKDTDTIGVLTEPVSGKNTTVYTYDETKRLSARLTVNNKYATDTSSEGFYIYVFKEYTTKLHPKDIYMKVEFNHAGVGQTLPFTIPMNSGMTAPLSLKNENDVKMLKDGIPLADIYRQRYIHFKGVYDSLKQHYVYYLAPEYTSCYKKIKGTETYKMQFNIFEIKIKNEANLNSPTN